MQYNYFYIYNAIRMWMRRFIYLLRLIYNTVIVQNKALQNIHIR